MNTIFHRPYFSRSLLLVAALMALLSVPLAAADRFIKIGDIKGESTDEHHRDWCEFVDFKFGVTVPMTLSGPAGPPNFDELVIIKVVDKASPLLFLKCSSSDVLPTVQLKLFRPGATPQVYYVVTLTDAVITSVKSENSGAVLVESVAFTFRKIQISYTPQSGPPAITAGWDRQLGIPFP